MAATEKAVIIMVHGAFHRPIHYEPVLRALRDKGFTVLAPELPTTGLDPSLTYTDDVELINQVLEPVFNEGKEVVVVAHSFGALPASHCIEGESVTERKECGLKGGIRHYINVCGMSYAEKGKDFMGKHNEFAAQDYHRVEVSTTCIFLSQSPSNIIIENRDIPVSINALFRSNHHDRMGWCIYSTRRSPYSTATLRQNRSRSYGRASSKRIV